MQIPSQKISGIIGAETVSRAAPDGNTLLIHSNSLLIDAHLQKTNDHPLTSFEPICDLVDVPTVIVVNSAAPYRRLADLLNAARAKPGELTLASAGPASSPQIAFEMLKHLAHVNMIFVPFNGNGPAVNALLGKHVDSVLVNYSEVAEQLQDGTFRALATTSRSRIGELPQVPAVAEFGFNDFEAEVWFGTVVPARTPAAVVAELADWLRAALDARTVKPKLKALGLYTVGRCGAAFAADLRRRFDDYGRAIRESNIRVE